MHPASARAKFTGYTMYPVFVLELTSDKNVTQTHDPFVNPGHLDEMNSAYMNRF